VGSARRQLGHDAVALDAHIGGTTPSRPPSASRVVTPWAAGDGAGPGEFALAPKPDCAGAGRWDGNPRRAQPSSGRPASQVAGTSSIREKRGASSWMPPPRSPPRDGGLEKPGSAGRGPDQRNARHRGKAQWATRGDGEARNGVPMTRRDVHLAFRRAERLAPARGLVGLGYPARRKSTARKTRFCHVETRVRSPGGLPPPSEGGTRRQLWRAFKAGRASRAQSARAGVGLESCPARCRPRGQKMAT